MRNNLDFIKIEYSNGEKEYILDERLPVYSLYWKLRFCGVKHNQIVEYINAMKLPVTEHVKRRLSSDEIFISIVQKYRDVSEVDCFNEMFANGILVFKQGKAYYVSITIEEIGND